MLTINVSRNYEAQAANSFISSSSSSTCLAAANTETKLWYIKAFKKFRYYTNSIKAYENYKSNFTGLKEKVT